MYSFRVRLYEIVSSGICNFVARIAMVVYNKGPRPIYDHQLNMSHDHHGRWVIRRDGEDGMLGRGQNAEGWWSEWFAG